MKCIVTAGPTYEDLDEVRRLTNFSTGALGCGLADYFVRRGHSVELLLGYYSTVRPVLVAKAQSFTTTADLRRRLEALASRNVHAVFHVAAVSDFGFGRIWARTPKGTLREIRSKKISTREGTPLLAELKPTPKIIRHLRGLFPNAFLTGWKYELEGSRTRAFARAAQQMDECHTDACVVNGRAYGNGFGIVSQDGVTHLPDKRKLFAELERNARRHMREPE